MFTATSFSHSAMLISSMPLPMNTPALFTRMSSLPNRLVARSTAAVHWLFLRHVQVDVLGLPAFCIYGGDGLPTLLIQHIADHHAGAGLRHQPGGLSANAARGTGDQNDLAIETTHRCFPFCLDRWI